MAHIAHRGSRLPLGVEMPERYEIRGRIATGGMASVWCAHDCALGRNVAIKLLSEPYAHDPAAARRFKREARAAAHLSSHPHVVTIYDVGEAGSDGHVPQAFLVMEYLAGGTVADALRVGAVNRGDVIHWLHQAGAALDYAHGRGVVHRDIKPVNFLLDCNRVLHVADFGIAHIGTEDTIGGTGEILGTAAYLAPERALGRATTEASDRYSLAVTAFELLTGERPFGAENFAAQARQHVEDEPPRASRLNAALPAAVDRVLARGLAKRPEERWHTAGAFAEAIELALSQVAARRRPAPAPFLLQDKPRSRTSRIGAALVALAVAAFAIGAIIGNSSHPASSDVRAATKTPHSTSSNAKPVSHAAKPQRHRNPASTTAAPAAPTTTAAASAPAPSADALEAQGHTLMDQGNYPAAVSTLRHAVAAASPGSLTYAYAMFDLGRSLRLGGDPQAAIPILWRRMQIPNQTDVVRRELQLALREVGQTYSHSGAAAPCSPAHHDGGAGGSGHDHQGGGGGGQGGGGGGPQFANNLGD